MMEPRDVSSGLFRLILCIEAVDRRASRLGCRHRLGIMACLLLWVASTGHQISHLPSRPVPMGDTQDYLTLASHRPPVYGWMLAAYQWFMPGLHGLPLFQLLLMSLCLLWFAVELGLLLDSSVAGPVAIGLIVLHPAIHDAPRIAETESVFLAFILGGLALLFRAVRIGGPAY